MENNKICYNNYTDDSQILTAISPEDFSLTKCFAQINDWMSQNFPLYKDKTVFIVLGEKEEPLKISAHHTKTDILVSETQTWILTETIRQ